MSTAAILPLEKRVIPLNNKNGLLKEAPAVHKVWVEARSWTRYETPPDAGEIHLAGALDTWLATARSISSQLSWVLRLPCNVFWSQLCHDENLTRWLGDVMETFPREHDRQPWWTEAVREAHKTILQKLFLVHVRLCTYKESNKDFFSPEYWGELLYEKCLLGLPRLLDICVLFFPCNKSITAKMVGNVLKQQPLFYNDLVESSLTMLAALDSCQEQFQLLAMSQPHLTELASFLEMISYCLDISVSLHSLVSVYPAACDVLHQTGLDVSLGGFYSQVLIPLTNLIQKYNSAGCLSQTETASQAERVKLARHNILATLRAGVCQLCLLDSLDLPDRVETFLTLMTSLLSDISLLTDYNNLYPIRAEFELFEAQQAEVDAVRKNYILDMFNSTLTNGFMVTSGAGGGGGRGGGGGGRGEKEKPEKSPPESEEMLGACSLAGQPSSVELVSLVSGVRDLLPHLGEGFVERVLLEFNYKADLAINALLEDNLPSHLRSLDQAMPRQEEKPPSPPPAIRSVYDEDEFDVFSRAEVDMTRIHRGKKNIAKDANKLLEDKADLVGMKDRFDRLGIVEDIEIVARLTAEVDLGNEYEYDDEYDDTYDDIAVGEQEPDAQDEHGRGFVLPVALGGGKVTNTRGPVEESEEEEDEAGDVKSKMNFVRNPEEVRQEKERKRQEKISKNRSHNTPPNRDVVGKAKGQGQEKQVLINRARKNANKGKGHRNAADRKSAKGMF